MYVWSDVNGTGHDASMCVCVFFPQYRAGIYCKCIDSRAMQNWKHVNEPGKL